jgi:hypothetical protein
MVALTTKGRASLSHLQARGERAPAAGGARRAARLVVPGRLRAGVGPRGRRRRSARRDLGRQCSQHCEREGGRHRPPCTSREIY